MKPYSFFVASFGFTLVGVTYFIASQGTNELFYSQIASISLEDGITQEVEGSDEKEFVVTHIPTPKEVKAELINASINSYYSTNSSVPASNPLILDVPAQTTNLSVFAGNF